MATKTTGKAASKKSAKKSGAKKKPNKKDGTKKAKPTKKTAAKKKAAALPAGMVSLGEGESCGACVRRVIAQMSGRTPKLEDKMSDLFVPCNPDVMARLRDALRQCSGRAVQVVCGKTVRRLLNEYCG